MQGGIEGDMVTGHCIEDRKELSHASGECELWGFALLDQMSIEATDSRIEMCIRDSLDRVDLYVSALSSRQRHIAGIHEWRCPVRLILG